MRTGIFGAGVGLFNASAKVITPLDDVVADTKFDETIVWFSDTEFVDFVTFALFSSFKRSLLVAFRYQSF